MLCKRLFKWIRRAFLLALLAALCALGVLVYEGYALYRDALAEQSLEDRVAEIRENPSYRAHLRPAARCTWAQSSR